MPATTRLLPVCMALTALLGALPARSSDGAGPPTFLRCEFTEDPVGLDCSAPRLSWFVNDARRGAAQTAYQIEVATDLEHLDSGVGLVWDTGKVGSDESNLTPYGGPPLRSGTRYHWRVRTWDRDGRPSPFSEVASWEMGLLSPADWHAQWIAPAPPAEAGPEWGKWIWHPSATGAGARIGLRRSFELPANVTVVSAELRIAVDNTYVLFVNGRRAGRGDAWERPGRHNVTALLRAGRNTIAVEATNTDGPCGANMGLLVRLSRGEPIRLSTDASWRVAEKPEGDWLETGFDDSNWRAAAEIAPYGSAPWGAIGGSDVPQSAYLRKPFRLEGDIVSARAYVTGLGLYELRLNGRKVGDEYLTPGWTHYFKRVQYRAYDVANMLRQGDNVAGAVLGNGWWGGNMAGQWRDGPPRFLLQLVVRYGDGRRQEVVTDGTWRWAPSPILENSLYHGETYDARKELPGWDAAGFAPPAEWAPVRAVPPTSAALVAQLGPPIRATEELSPAAITEPKAGVFVVDFGQNMPGWCRSRVTGEAGTEVRLRFAEVLKPDGTVYTENYRSARATDTYICRGGGEEEWEPRFTYRGFRYVEVTGYPGTPDARSFTARVVHSAPDVIGEFSCSNDVTNRIQHNIVWGQRSNMHSVPTDCPQRDERLGWTGDAEAFAPTACWNLEMASFFEKWLRDLSDSQAANGAVTDVAPTTGGGPASPAWGDAMTIVPWNTYVRYGDLGIVRENLQPMRRWVDYMRGQARGDLYEREGYGDWVAVVGSPKKPIGAAYYYLSTKLVAEMARAAGENSLARDYGDLAGRIRDAFNAAYLDPSTHQYPGATQCANALPLAFGLTPDAARAAVAANLSGDVRGRGDHLSTGFLGTGPLLPVLTDAGYGEQAYRVATQTTYPSWGYMAEKGATTIWELWNSDTQGPGMNSRNHFALGGVGDWYYQYLAGIRPDPAKPGFRHFTVRPEPLGDLRWVNASYRSPYGWIRCSWRREPSGEFVLDLTVPASSGATVVLPTRDAAAVWEGGKPAEWSMSPTLQGDRVAFEVGAGRYEFRVR